MEERFKVALNATTDTSREQARAERVSSGESLAEKMVSLFFPTRAVAAMAVAAALVVCIQAGIIFSMVDGVQNGNQYETASGEEEVTGISTRFLVKFTPDVEFASVEKLLKEQGGQILNGPTADGLYELGFKGDGQSEDLTQLLSAETKLFQFVLPKN